MVACVCNILVAIILQWVHYENLIILSRSNNTDADQSNP